MAYIVELRTPSCPAAYVLAQAETQDDARALVGDELGRIGDVDEFVIVAVHSIH